MNYFDFIDLILSCVIIAFLFTFILVSYAGDNSKLINNMAEKICSYENKTFLSVDIPNNEIKCDQNNITTISFNEVN